MHGLVSRSDHLSARPQRELSDGEKRPVTAEEEVDKAARKRSGDADDATRLLNLKFVSHLCALFGSNSFFTLDGENLLK